VEWGSRSEGLSGRLGICHPPQPGREDRVEGANEKVVSEKEGAGSWEEYVAALKVEGRNVEGRIRQAEVKAEEVRCILTPRSRKRKESMENWTTATGG
jgi:hypothetical protein